MIRAVSLSLEPVARHPLPFRPAFVRIAVADRYPGVYLLLRRGRPIYIGRSDTCVRTRLATHPYRGAADSFVWHPCRDRLHAFHLESYWYHSHRQRGIIGNMVHPARPAGTRVICPFCDHPPDVLFRDRPVAAGSSPAVEMNDSISKEPV